MSTPKPADGWTHLDREPVQQTGPKVPVELCRMIFFEEVGGEHLFVETRAERVEKFWKWAL